MRAHLIAIDFKKTRAHRSRSALNSRRLSTLGENTVEKSRSRLPSGDIVVADTDGVLAIPQAHVARALKGARKRTDKEALTMKRLQAGETTLELLGLAAERRKPR